MNGPRNQLLTGDALEVLRTLPNNLVDTVITSPPYFRLRDYGVPGQLGLERHVDEWVERLQAVMAELARVLKPGGSVWLNLSDSYERTGKSGSLPKSLLLGPERLLLRLLADGWIVRNQVVWAKTNPIPASVRDRLTASHERVFFLVRSRRYYFDLDAIRVPHRSRRRPTNRQPERGPPPAWAGPLAGSQHGLDRLHARGLAGHTGGKNPGDVWRLPTAGFRGAHFAVFPEALVERPLRASCPERTCRACGTPWRPRGKRPAPDCSCGSDWQPGLVLDPLIGSGTVAVVAERLGRDWLGIDLNPAFIDLARQRIELARAGRAGALRPLETAR